MKSTDFVGPKTDSPAIRQGRAQCETCEGQGIVHEGQVDIVWRSAKIRQNKKTGQIKRGYKSIGRPSIEGEACPSCFGTRFSNEIDNPEEAKQFRQPSNAELLGANWLARAAGHGRQLNYAGTYEGQGQMAPNPGAPRQELAGGVTVQESDDGMVEFSFD